MTNSSSSRQHSWSAVFGMTLCAFALIASEFMPVSLLTPIAANLHISEGSAGQAISISGAFALFTSLFISYLAGRVDRKLVLLGLTLIMIASGLVVTFAPSYIVFMVGRALIGIAIGGFWSMSAATAMRLVPKESVPKALAILNGGNALATVIAAPLGSFLGAVIGWRGAFFCIVPVTIIAFTWLWISLPSLPVQRAATKNVFGLLKRPLIAVGMLAITFFFMGQFTLFTYLRPFLETITHTGPTMLSLMLLVVGVSGFIGTTLIGMFIKRGPYRTLIVIPALMAIIALALIAVGYSLFMTAILLAVWGLIATSAPVAWWTWLAESLPDDAEAGGGLIVAIIQLAITLGATLGGLLFDSHGYSATFSASALLLLMAALLAFITYRISLRHSV
ncbi:MFS transporter [Zymobacter palmae]|uniref:Arabinose efflux permease n=1 Tax=Zymobacter palmae TaxID=33074 RepID=A0A348HIE5_9GAMM|nr:MFS transporter [Zymobacter palmae]BBG31397.1 arabinose efflux permease [Zymobacter palmae]